jgi:integrase
MSVHREKGKWRVKYRVAGKQRSRTFDRKSDARTFDAEVTRRRQLGPALVAELDRELMTLEDYVRGPWRAHAATLAKPTRLKYAWALEKHLSELLEQALITIDAPMIAAHQRLLIERGATPSTVREVMAKLSGILQIATEHGHMPANPARAVRSVPAAPGEEIDPLTPIELECLLGGLRGRDRAIALLGGHFGLRPLEIRQVRWTDLSENALMIGRAQTKAAARRPRVITGPAVAVRELRAWQLESGGRGSDPIIGDLTANALRLWGYKRLRPAVKAATDGRITGATTYTLRHSHASACHYVSTLTVPEICRRLGHSQQTHFLHYAHVIDSISGERYTDLDALVAAARADLMFRQSSEAVDIS